MAVSDLTDIPLLDLMATGWQKCDQLTEVARESLRSEDPTLVDMVTHEITSVHQPYVEIIVDETVVDRIQFDIRCVCLIKALTVTIQRGRMTALHTGHCDLTGRVSLTDFEVANIEGHISLPLALQLKKAIPLVDWPRHGKTSNSLTQ